MSENISTPSESETATQSVRGETAPRRRVPMSVLLDALASVKFAVTVVILIALACVAGTLLPQGTETAAALIVVGLFTVFYLNPWLESRRARA